MKPKKRIEDNVEALKKESGPEFDENYVYYSNQGKAGTCVRHAIAKAIQYYIIKYIPYIDLKTSNLVTALLTTKPEYGAGGACVLDYDKVRIMLQGIGGHIYEILIRVKEGDKRQTDFFNLKENNGKYWKGIGIGGRIFVIGPVVVSVDLRELLPEYSTFKEPQYHAMFCPDTNNLLNSWGHYHEEILVKQELNSLLLYNCWIDEMKLMGYGKRNDIQIFKDGKYNSTWNDILCKEKRHIGGSCEFINWKEEFIDFSQYNSYLNSKMK